MTPTAHGHSLDRRARSLKSNQTRAGSLRGGIVQGLRAGALVTLATFAVVCAACGGGTAETSSEDGPSASAAESGTTSVPKPETATEQPDEDDASDPDNDGDGGDDDVVAAGTTVPEPQNAAPTVGVIAASEVAAGEAVTVDLSSFFGDPDGDELAYEVHDCPESRSLAQPHHTPRVEYLKL